MVKWWSINPQLQNMHSVAKPDETGYLPPFPKTTPPTFCRVVAAKPLTFAPGSWRLDKGVISHATIHGIQPNSHGKSTINEPK